MRGLYTTIISFFLFASAQGQVVINEVSNANGSLIKDDLGKEEDYIELFNNTDESVNLQGFSISDNRMNLRKWSFPNKILAKRSYLLLWADEGVSTDKFLHLNFKLAKEGEKIFLSNSNGIVVDSFYVGQLHNNHSQGRKPDGNSNICFFDLPSPGKSNNASPCFDGYEPDPVFSQEGGFFPSSQNINISVPFSSTGDLRYSVNGKFPDSSSLKVSGQISIDNSTVLAARNLSTGNKLPSRMVSKTYLVAEQGVNLPVFSISIDPWEMFDSINGMYMKGPTQDSIFPYKSANFWKDWERRCHVEYYDNNKVKLFDYDAGLKIHGGFSRALPQRSLRLKFRGDYGAGKLKYPIIPEKEFIKSFDAINLRNGGQDYYQSRFRDAFLQRVMKFSHVGTMGYEPSIVFINGKYWGEYEIREKQDEHFIESNYKIPMDKIDLLAHQGVLKTKCGSNSNFYKMYNEIMATNPYSPDFYSKAAGYADLENFVDYFAAETYYNNNDWIRPTGNCNNVKLWRSQLPGGKWRYLFWDLDQTTGIYGGKTDTNSFLNAFHPQTSNVHSDLIRTLCQNPQFRNYFVNRYADLLNTVFQYDSLKKVAEPMKNEISSSMGRHIERWGGNLTAWSKSIDRMLNWHITRVPAVRNHLQSEFGLKGQVEVTVNSIPAGAGRIRISTVVPKELPWKGVYYNGVPVTISAIANPGYTFKYWDANGILTQQNGNKNITVDIDKNASFVAHFEGTPKGPAITISEINYHSDPGKDDGDWVELYNYDNIPLDLSAWKITDAKSENVFEFSFGTVINPSQRIVLVSDTLKFKAEHPGVSYVGQLPFSFKNDGENIRLLDYRNSLVKSVSYTDHFPWPVGSDGYGRTLELANPTDDLNNPASWFDGCIGGSPGKAYTPCNDPIVFSEINYFSGPERNIEDWVELYNTTNSSINISKWVFKAGKDSNSYSIPANTVVLPKQHLLLVKSQSTFNNDNQRIQTFTGPFGFELSNEGDGLRLYDSIGGLKFSVNYSSKYPWPSKAYGKGKTLELKDVNGKMNNATNWFAGCVDGSPGQNYVPCADEEGTNPSVSIWPNPSSNEMNITIEKGMDESWSYSIFDLLGRQVLPWNSVIGNQLILMKEQLQAGVYFLKIKDGEKEMISKIVFTNKSEN